MRKRERGVREGEGRFKMANGREEEMKMIRK